MLIIKDDGEGFSTAVSEELGGENQVSSNSGGIGHRSMRQRVALLGGKIAIRSVPKAGTTITIEVPVK